MMRQEYLNKINRLASEKKIEKKGCGCGKKPTSSTPIKPQPGKR